MRSCCNRCFVCASIGALQLIEFRLLLLLQLLADTISSIPGNQRFDRDIEFSSCVKIFLGKKAYLASEVVFYLCLITQNVAAIIATAQAVDSFFAQFLFGSSWALQFAPTFEAIHWSTSQCGDEPMCVPFEGEGTLILTAGYLVTAVALLPFGLQNLKENMVIQKVSFFFLIVLCLQFFYAFYEQGMQSENLTWFGRSYSHLIGAYVLHVFAPVCGDGGKLTSYFRLAFLPNRHCAVQLRIPHHDPVLAA